MVAIHFVANALPFVAFALLRLKSYAVLLSQ